MLPSRAYKQLLVMVETKGDSGGQKYARSPNVPQCRWWTERRNISDFATFSASSHVRFSRMFASSRMRAERRAAHRRRARQALAGQRAREVFCRFRLRLFRLHYREGQRRVRHSGEEEI